MSRSRLTPDGARTGTVVLLGPDYGTEADLVEQASAAHTEQQTMTLTRQSSLAHAELLTAVLTRASSLAHTEQQTMTLTRQSDITLLQYTTSTILASKDSWCDVLAGCPVDTNRNATDLQIEGVTATKKDIMVGWDLSGFPTGATVTAATVTWNVKTVATVSAVMARGLITEANETWSESTVKCSNIPGFDGGSSNSVVDTGVAGEQVDTLTSAHRTRIAARMGVGTFSLRYQASSATGTNAVLESKDEGTNNASGPRLTITWTMPA